MLKNVGVLLIGILVGAIGGDKYFYNKSSETSGALMAAKSEAASASKALRERDEQLQKLAASASTTLRERDEQLQKVKAELAAAENTLKGATARKEPIGAFATRSSQTRIRGRHGGPAYAAKRPVGPRHSRGWEGPGYGYDWSGGPGHPYGWGGGPGYGYGW
jgi:hypothetical protein